MLKIIEKLFGSRCNRGKNNVKLFSSVVDSTIVHKFDEADWCADLVQYATYKCKIDGLIASAFLFCPEIIQVEEYIFVKQFWNWSVEESIKGIRQLEKQYCGDKKKIEMSVNSWSIGDFFLNDSRKLLDDDDVIMQFGNLLSYFWKNRVKDLFPDRKIVVELGYELMGELGLCITMYEEI